MSTPDLTPEAAAARILAPSIDPAVLDRILGGQKSDPTGEGFDTLIATARTQLAAGWSTDQKSDGEELIVVASAPIVANELTAIIDNATEQIKFYTAQREAAKDVIKDAMVAESKRIAAQNDTDTEGGDTLPEKITFKINQVPSATWNLAKDSRQLDTEWIKTKYPDVPKNEMFWKTVPGTRRFLVK